MTAQQSAQGRVSRARNRPGSIRLPIYRNPLRLVFSASPWRSAWFLFCYLVLSWLTFAAVFAATATTAVLAITLAGIPLLIAAAGVIRGCASAERWRLRGVLGEHLRGGYRPVTAPGIVAQVRTRWRDPATWRDLAYLVGLFAPLMVVDYAVVLIWLILLGGVTMPAWYWAPKNSCVGYCAGPQPRGVPFGYFPHGPHGPGAAGLYVDTMPKALLAAAGFLVLFLLFNYVLVLTARMHAWVARALLRPPSDPLAEAREVLARPGPLPPLVGEGGAEADGSLLPGSPGPP